MSARTRQSEYVRIWTALGSYFFAKANVTAEIFGKTNFKNPAEYVKFAMDMMMLFVVEALLVGLMRNTWPDDDEEKSTAAWIAGQTLSSAMSSYPLFREAASEISGFRGGSAASGFYKAIGDAWEQGYEQGELDMALIKSFNKVGGIMLKYPAGAINRFVDSSVKYSQGEDVDLIDFLMWTKKD